jgi:predicted DsbA family dithiol-disulfide isomerase
VYDHRVLAAYFVEDPDIGDITMLTELEGEVALGKKGFEIPLPSRKNREAHRRALRPAQEVAGVTVVPTFVIEGQGC